MILTIEIDLAKVEGDVHKRCLALVDMFHQLAHEVATIGNGPTTKLPVLLRHAPGSVRVGEWQVHFDTGIDS